MQQGASVQGPRCISTVGDGTLKNIRIPAVNEVTVESVTRRVAIQQKINGSGRTIEMVYEELRLDTRTHWSRRRAEYPCTICP